MPEVQGPAFLWPTHARPPGCGSAFLAERVHTPTCTRARERFCRRRHHSPCSCLAPLRCAAPSLMTAGRACHPYHALVLVGRAVDALYACWHTHILFPRLADTLSAAREVLPPRCAKAGSTSSSGAFMRTRSCANSLAMTSQPRRWGSLFPVRHATSSPWVDTCEGCSFVYPISALASHFALFLALSNCTHTHACVRDAEAAR
jgi:hypothetical protein